jgi:hypothetical protein
MLVSGKALPDLRAGAAPHRCERCSRRGPSPPLRRVLRLLPDGGLRRLRLDQRTRHRPESVLAGQAARRQRCHRISVVMTLVETGTRALPGAVFGTPATAKHLILFRPPLSDKVA